MKTAAEDQQSEPVFGGDQESREKKGSAVARKRPIYLIWPQFALCSSSYKITRGLTKKLRFLPIFLGGEKMAQNELGGEQRGGAAVPRPRQILHGLVNGFQKAAKFNRAASGREPGQWLMGSGGFAQ